MGRPRIVLAGLSPSLQGLRWESDTSLRIGQHYSADIVLRDPTVGKLHAEVVLHNGKWVVRHLLRNDRQSTPTLLNGRRIADDCPVQVDDIIQCGNLTLKVAATAEADAPLTSTQVLPVLGMRGSCIKTTSSFLRVEASATHSWEQAVQALTQQRPNSPSQHNHLSTLLRAGHHLSHIGSLEKLLESVLADAVAALNAQRGSIILADPFTNVLSLRTCLAPKLARNMQGCYSRTMAARSFQDGESLLCSDVNTEAALQAATSVRVGAMSSLILRRAAVAAQTARRAPARPRPDANAF